MKLTIIIAINRFVSSVSFHNRADKAFTEKSSERRALILTIVIVSKYFTYQKIVIDYVSK